MSRILLALAAASLTVSAAVPEPHPGCADVRARQCVDLALGAMGGREWLEQLKSVRLQLIGHTLLME